MTLLLYFTQVIEISKEEDIQDQLKEDVEKQILEVKIERYSW